MSAIKHMNESLTADDLVKLAEITGIDPESITKAYANDNPGLRSIFRLASEAHKKQSFTCTLGAATAAMTIFFVMQANAASAAFALFSTIAAFSFCHGATQTLSGARATIIHRIPVAPAPAPAAA